MAQVERVEADRRSGAESSQPIKVFLPLQT